MPSTSRARDDDLKAFTARSTEQTEWLRVMPAGQWLAASPACSQ